MKTNVISMVVALALVWIVVWAGSRAILELTRVFRVKLALQVRAEITSYVLFAAPGSGKT